MRLALLLLAGAALAAAQDKMGLWSPLYYKIKPATGDEYSDFIAAVGSNKCLQNSFQGAIVTGPTSQPPPLQDPSSPGKDARYNEYMRRFNVLAQAPGWQPFGYVYTKYGNRPLDAVLADIGNWCNEVDGFRKVVRGVFVDSVAEAFPPCAAKDANDPSKCLSLYYKTIVDAINSQCSSATYGSPMIMFNPGRRFDECKFMADNGVGFVNGFENTWDVFQKFSANKDVTCPCKDTKLADGSPIRCVASLHSVPATVTVDDVTAAMQTLANNGFSAVFLTENKDPHQYETVPTIWPVFTEAACKVDAYNSQKAQAAAAAAAAAAAPAAGNRKLLSV